MTVFAVAAIAISLAIAGPVLAEGSVVLSTTYPSVVADKGRALTFPVEVTNRTGDFVTVDLRVAEGPASWNPDLRDRGFSIRTVMLGPDKAQSLEFSATPPANAPSGDYAFLLRALAGGATVSELRVMVTLRDVVSSGITLATQFPNVRGQAGSTFSFKFDLANKAGVERDIGLSASAAQGWEAMFKPSFESKQVSSFRVKAGETQGVDVDVSGPQKLEAGEYKVVIVASAGADKAEVPLTIAIAGQSRLAFGTSDGRLNTRATVDQETKLPFILKNTGSAPLPRLTFSSSPPEGWQIAFQPDRVDELAPEQQIDVTAIIRPSSRALAGDYVVSLTASAPGASDSKSIRVTVETPTTWGIVGLLAIAGVLGGLGWVFVRYSRR
ncbi:MAG: hypothetical protein HY553_03080 [Elusimicrobia bacterium]|nr:hypothetical protein [Elusimicrobiota bacterium]